MGGAGAGAAEASPSIVSFVAFAKAGMSSFFSTTTAIGSPILMFSEPSGIKILATYP